MKALKMTSAKKLSNVAENRQAEAEILSASKIIKYRINAETLAMKNQHLEIAAASAWRRRGGGAAKAPSASNGERKRKWRK
jgi:hypothetical protein